MMDDFDNIKRRASEDEILGRLRDDEIVAATPYRPMYAVNYMQPAVCEHGETPWNCGACIEWRRQ